MVLFLKFTSNEINGRNSVSPDDDVHDPSVGQDEDELGK